MSLPVWKFHFSTGSFQKIYQVYTFCGCFLRPAGSKKKLVFLYGKWTEGLRACKAALYEETIERIKRETKGPQGSPGHKKVLAKLHSLKVGAFKPSHQDAIDEGGADGEECLPVDEIPGSTTLWEVAPRPANSSEVSSFDRNRRANFLDIISGRQRTLD